MGNDSKYLDKPYIRLVQDILDNKEFDKMGEIIHHGLDRKSHSLRVSYYSYKICKALRLNFESAARAGLLHDFFFENNQESTILTRAKTLVNHPKYALKNANDIFKLTELEQDIIVSHMFPISVKPPKYAESWVVNLVDDAVAIAEIGYKARNKVSYALNFALILMIAYFK